MNTVLEGQPYRSLAILCACWVGLAPELAAGESEQKAGDRFQYVRLAEDENGETRSLDVAITSFVSQGAQTQLQVDLVGALHVAEAKYFQQLNKRFETYDAVLYELVAPEGTRIPLGGVESSGPISLLQGGMTGVLGLTYQLDEIDYTRRNFVHADMTPEEFAASMKKRKESLGKMLFRAIGHAMAKQSTSANHGADLRMLTSMFSDHREHELKVLMAEQFADLNGAMEIYQGVDGSTLITERNKKALSVLKKQIASGKTKLAIFYGAGHMQDMEERLLKGFDLRRTSAKWLPAWDLRKASIPLDAGTTD